MRIVSLSLQELGKTDLGDLHSVALMLPFLPACVRNQWNVICANLNVDAARGGRGVKAGMLYTKPNNLWDWLCILVHSLLA